MRLKRFSICLECCLDEGDPYKAQWGEGALQARAARSGNRHLNAALTHPVFGEVEPARLLAVDDLFAVVSDKFPVSPGHTLIIARRPVARFQELTSAEKGPAPRLD